ncbi:16S rRNA (guanine(527)-N(7))-methyltransferase RsmG [Sphingomonas gilva]|uniref:Ribosomal RNA small subunit methyltransferase G n=1 Tax=Sphingomonas gilva TaxID=2305907 RepID=A0A396RMM3_9SPHN|nr:16S rRNA (guanine(527)-N(7))-methyltransferase RsmG [Sphingomonas gilva]RHW17687.1 16S rRNA (guanine(527)-N(7))-methyltransferase RsmG [Sphingomonas gilva]
MTEEQAREWLRSSFDVSRGAWAKLERFVGLLISENSRQNLIAPASVEHIWTRHIADSAQLLSWASSPALWVDIGSGAGLPGMVLAILRDAPMVLVEPRRKRADFLDRAARALDLPHVQVEQRDIRKIDGKAAVISARAVASLPMLLDMAHHLAASDTIWVLPKGRNADDELVSARATWHGVFHVEQSITEPGSKIIVATKVARRTP